MGTLESLLKRLYPDVYKEKESSISEIHNIFSAIADSFDFYYAQVAELLAAACVYLSTEDFLTILSRGYGWDRFAGESDAFYKLRFKAFLGMPKCGTEYILDIIQLYTGCRPTLVEVSEFTFNVYLCAGSAQGDPNYLFSIGDPPDWGCGIGDDGTEFAGAIGAFGEGPSLTYLQYILDQIKPAGTVGTVVSAE